MQAYRDSTDICNTKQVGNDPSPSSKILNIQSVILSKLCYLRTRLAFQGWKHWYNGNHISFYSNLKGNNVTESFFIKLNKLAILYVSVVDETQFRS